MKNVLKLEGFGLYVTYIDNKIYTSKIQSQGYPKLDPDGCIDWEELKDPPNQEFLDEINRRWGLTFMMSDFGKYMSVSECLWYVKNLRERDK